MVSGHALKGIPFVSTEGFTPDDCAKFVLKIRRIAGYTELIEPIETANYLIGGIKWGNLRKIRPLLKMVYHTFKARAWRESQTVRSLIVAGEVQTRRRGMP